MKAYLNIILGILVLLDLGYSFYLNYHLPLDGDLPAIVQPESGPYEEVLKHPFATDVLIHGEQRANPNRFFAHLALSNWFQTVPFALQTFQSPIESVYWASALARTLIQVVLLYLFALIISNESKIRSSNFLLAALLIAPLFQTFGFNRQLGLLDKSITYCFFYALPLALTLLFLSPFFRKYLHQKVNNFSILKIMIWIVLIPVLSLSGPLIPGIVAVLVVIYMGSKILKKPLLKSWERLTASPLETGLIILLGAGTLYSLYIGTFNKENADSSTPSLVSRYLQMPLGILKLLTNKLGFPLLLIAIFTNLWIIKKGQLTSQGKRMLIFLKYGLLFSLLYLLLLPLGGYRHYRPEVVRYDTFLPITIFIFLAFGLTTYFLLQQRNFIRKRWYQISIAIVLIIFTIADQKNDRHFQCEKSALTVISNSRDSIVRLDQNCPILHWDIIRDPKYSNQASQLLKYWRITEQKKLFFSVQ